jgi:hypothetical protein
MRLVAAVPSALATALLASPGVHAEPCKRIHTTITTTFFVDGCTSPVGVCTAGEVRSGPLKGTTRFRALTVAEGPSPDVMLYTGELVITTKSGEVTIRDAGVLDGPAGRYFEIQQVVGGTKAFQRATGLLTSQGLATSTGFSGSLTGQLCKEKPGKGPHQRSAEEDSAEDLASVDPDDAGA